jgi:hypothetical protein
VRLAAAAACGGVVIADERWPRAGAKICGLEICRGPELTGVDRSERWPRSLFHGMRGRLGVGVEPGGGGSGRRRGELRRGVREEKRCAPKAMGEVGPTCRRAEAVEGEWRRTSARRVKGPLKLIIL